MPTHRGQGSGAGAGRFVRCAALCQLLVFALGLFSTGAGLHGCPRQHHSRADAGASGQAAKPNAATIAYARGPAPADSPAGPGGCHCLGACQSGAAVALRPVPPGLAVDPAVAPATPLPGDAGALSIVRPDYFLPFPLGPPAA